MKISILALAAATVADTSANSSERNERTARKVSIGGNDIPAQLRVLGADASSEEVSHGEIVMGYLADMAHLHEASESHSDESEDPSYRYKNRRHHQRRIEKRNKNEKRKRLGGKRLKLFCDEKFRWQGEKKCQSYCLEVDGDIEEGDEIRLAECSNRIYQQRWKMDGKVLRPAGDPKLCVKGTKLKRCDNEVELIGGSKFEIHSKKNGRWCLSNPHEPKVRELVDFRECRRARNSHTNLWKFA